MKPIYITHWWGKKYEEKAKRWITHCKRANIEHVCVERKLNEKINYQEAINNKVDFIISMLKKWKRPVVYLDVDTCVKGNPILFNLLEHYDLMCFNWNADKRVTNTIDPYVFETPGCVMGFGNTKQTLLLLNTWKKYMSQKIYARVADDRMIAMIIHDKGLVNTLRCMWIPLNYCCYTEFYKCKNIVIEHPDKVTTENEAKKLGSYGQRIPKGYVNGKSITERGYGDMTGELVKQRNKQSQGIIHVTSYKDALNRWDNSCVICCNMKYKSSYASYDIITPKGETKYTRTSLEQFIIRPCGSSDILIKNMNKFNINPGFLLSMRVLLI